MNFSKYNSQLTLDTLRHKAEGQYLERKGAQTKSTKLANEIVGFLNADGGLLVFGISDTGELENLREQHDDTQLDSYRRIVHDLVTPPARIHLEELELDSGELLFLYHINHDCERVFMRAQSEDVYLRIADSNKGPLTREQVHILEYDRHIRKYEETPRPDFHTEDLNELACAAYVKRMNYEGSFTKLAVKRNLATKTNGEIIFNNAGILLFSETPSQYIPNASVRYIRYQGTHQESGKAFNVLKDQRFEGAIPQQIEQLKAFLNARFRDYHYLDLETGKFELLQEFPEDAWLEAVVNAICHRSYNLQGNEIYIKHYDDRLEISNSGPLPAQVTVENIKHERYSRNVRIARVLSEMGYVRELNEGVPRIYGAMHESMLAEPCYSDKNNTVTLVLRNNVSDKKETILATVKERLGENWKSLNDSQRKIINILLNEYQANLPKFVTELEIIEKSVRTNLKELIDLKIIEKVSKKLRDKNAIYRFPED